MSVEVTVITPAYNTEAYLEETIASVAAQTGVTFEHIIIDDCSTDGTADMMRAAAENHSHIRVLFQDVNQGQARARNRGIDEARGEYIAFLDSDDLYLSPDALATWLKAARLNAADMVGAQYKCFLDGQAPVSPGGAVVEQTRLGETLSSMPELVKYTSCWQFLLRKSFLDAHELRFSHRLRQREDRPFFTQALVAATSVNAIPDELVLYRVREGSTMRTPDPAQMLLFAIHMEIVNEAMTAVTSGSDASDYLAANQRYYLENIQRYWAAVFTQEGVDETPEFDAFFNACRCLSWSEEPVTDVTILNKAGGQPFAVGHLDVMRLLLVSDMKAAFVHFVKTAEVSLQTREKLYAILARKDLPADVARARKAIADRFLAAKPLPTMASSAASLPPIILHCGQTKTGSSAAQKFMEANRFKLLWEQGLYYPFTGLESGAGARAHRTSGHAGLIGHILNDGAHALDQLKAEVALLSVKPKAIFLSVENILSDRFWDKGAVVAKLASAFAGHDTTIICYMRRQDEWLESMYVESITSPGIRETGTAGEFAQRQKDEGLLDYTRVATMWRQDFPSANLVFRSYEQAMKDHGGTVEDILDAVGVTGIDLSTFDQPSKAHQNRSTSKTGALLIRQANERKLARRKVVRLNADIAALAGQHAEHEKGLGFLDSDARTELMGSLQAGNDAFYAAELPDAIWVTQRGVKSVGDISKADVVSPELQARFDDLFAQPLYRESDAELRSNGTGLRRDVLGVLLNVLKPRTFVALLQDRVQRQQLKEAVGIARAGYFDRRFYLETYPEVAQFSGGPILHYVQEGARLMFDPSAEFSTHAYLQENADVASAGVNPLYHFGRWGRLESRYGGVFDELDHG